MSRGILTTAITVTICTWYVAGNVLALYKINARTPPAAARTIYHELRPFFIPAVLIAHWVLPTLDGTSDWWNGPLTALHLYNWWNWRNLDDDDRWKRRAKKAATTVQRAGARLTVAPAGADT